MSHPRVPSVGLQAPLVICNWELVIPTELTDRFRERCGIEDRDTLVGGEQWRLNRTG